MINFSVHYPYQFDIVNSDELQSGDVNIALMYGDYVFNVKALRRGEELILPNSDLTFVFKSGTTVGGASNLTAVPSSDGLMPREFFKPFEFGFKYEASTSQTLAERDIIGQSEKDVIEYKKINILDERTSPTAPRVFSWRGNLYLMGIGTTSSTNGVIPCVNLYRWNKARDGFEKIHVFSSDTSSFAPMSCDYAVHNGELFLFYMSDKNIVTVYKALDYLASTWDKKCSFALDLPKEMWSYSNFRYRLRAASDSAAVMVVVMFAWGREHQSLVFQDAEFSQAISLDDCLSFSAAGDVSSSLIQSSLIGSAYYRQNKNVLGLFTISNNVSSLERLSPFNVNFDLYYDKNIGSFVIIKSGEGDDYEIEAATTLRLPNKCYLVGIKNISGSYFSWESCLKLPLDYSITVPDIHSYQNPFGPVFEERIDDVNTIYYNEENPVIRDFGIVVPAHARAFAPTDVCIVPGEAMNDIIITGGNFRHAFGGVFLDTVPIPDYADRIYTIGTGEEAISRYTVNEKAQTVLSTEFCFLQHDAVAPGNYDGKIYTYGGKFHDEISFICGPMIPETSSIIPKGFRSFGHLNGIRWVNPMGCRWNGLLLASASYSFDNNYTFFSVLGPMSNVGEKYGYQHNYCPYIGMEMFGWSEETRGAGSSISFSTPATWDSSRGYQGFSVTSATDTASYCQLPWIMVDRGDLFYGDDGDPIVKNRFSRYRTPLGRLEDDKFKARLSFSLNVDYSQVTTPVINLCTVKADSRKYSVGILKTGSDTRIVFKFDTGPSSSIYRSVYLEDIGIEPEELESPDIYIEVMFGNGLNRSGATSQFAWVRKSGDTYWVRASFASGLSAIFDHPVLDTETSDNSMWVGILKTSSMDSVDGPMNMRVRQVAVSSYGYQYRPSYSDSFRRLKIDAEGASAGDYYFETVKSYSPYVQLVDGTEVLLDPKTLNPSSANLLYSSYRVKRSRTKNAPENTQNGLSDSIYDFTSQYSLDPNFEIVFKTKDGLPVDCLSLINMVGFFAFELSSGDFDEETSTWTNKETESYFIPYTRNRVEAADGRTVLVEFEEGTEYQRDQLVGHSTFLYNLDTGSITDHRIIVSNFDRFIILDRELVATDRHVLRILKRNGSFDVPAILGDTGKNYFSISFVSSADASMRGIGEIVLGKWVDLSDFHLTVSREKTKGFEDVTSSRGLMYPGSTDEKAGLKDTLNIEFTKLSRAFGDAEFCLNLFSDIYSLEKNFPILLDYEGKPSTEYVALASNVTYQPDEYDYSMGVSLISQSPRSVPQRNLTSLNDLGYVVIEAYVGLNTIGFETSTGSLNLRAVPVGLDETGVEYFWDDGNGNTLSGSEIVVSYEQIGEYNIRLFAYRDGRQIATSSQTVYYIGSVISYYDVGVATITGNHFVTVTAKDADDNTVNDSTMVVYFEKLDAFDQVVASSTSTLLDGSALAVFPTTGAVKYRVYDINGASGEDIVDLSPTLPPITFP